MLIVRTQEVLGSDWSYEEAKRNLVKPRIGSKHVWDYPAEFVSKDASRILRDNNFPIDVHMILKTRTDEYFLIRRAQLLKSWKRGGRAKFRLKFGQLLFVDPDRYREIVKVTTFSWFGRGTGRQLIHLADKKYEHELNYAPVAEGKVARFLFYNEIEQRLRGGRLTR